MNSHLDSRLSFPRRLPWRAGRLGATFLLMAALLGGCRAAQVAQPLTGELAGNDPQSQIEFWHTLAERPVVSNDEAFHGLLLFLDGHDLGVDYAGRVAELQRREMLPKKFDRPANQGVRRGDLAVAILRVLEIRGGVVLRVLGPSPRYATRELEYANVYPRSSEQQTFTGAQFLGLIGRIEDMEQARGLGADVAPPDLEPAAPAAAPAQVQTQAG